MTQFADGGIVPARASAEPEPVRVNEDRSIRVPAGQVVVTGYVAVEDVKLACRAPMAVGDVERARARLLHCGRGQPFPCPVGYWDGGRFVIKDGRHEFVAGLMLGRSHILVAWLAEAAQPRARAAPDEELAGEVRRAIG